MLKTTFGLVVERQCLSGTLLDQNALRGGIQNIAIHRLGLLGGDGGAGSQVGYYDTAILIGDILAVIGTKHRAKSIWYRDRKWT